MKSPRHGCNQNMGERERRGKSLGPAERRPVGQVFFPLYGMLSGEDR